MIELLKRLARTMGRYSNPLFNYSVDKQSKYIMKFDLPKDDIERSFFQYKCQMELLGNKIAFLYGLVSAPLMAYYRVRLRKKFFYTSSTIDALFLFKGTNNILPDSLKKKYKITHIEDFHKNMSLFKEDIYILKELRRRHPFAWHFRFKCMLKVAMYSYCIKHYNPSRIIVSEEYSFTSSMLTYYCNRQNIEHINIMHGEKLFNMHDSFFHFNKCYVWEEYYKQLFVDLRAESLQFIVERPLSLLPWDTTGKAKTIDYTYYLSDEERKTLKEIANNIKNLQKANYIVSVRPHPIYNDVNEVKKVFSDFIIEDNEQISIQDSILRTKNAVSLYSTVLSQAKINGVNVIIDDITDPIKYNMLFKLRYHVIFQPHSKLSEELNKIKK